MNESKAHFEFNSAVTKISETNGAWNEKDHREAVLPMRGQIMQIDGVTGVYIARYGMDVEYYPEIVDRQTLIREIDRIMKWAAGLEKLFPLRADKVPAAKIEEPKPRKPAAKQQIIARFNSHIVSYPVTDGNDYDEAAFNRLTHDVLAKLADFDGVTDCAIALNGVRLTIDTGIAFVVEAKRHIESVLAQTMADHEHIFPYIQGVTGLALTFSVKDV